MKKNKYTYRLLKCRIKLKFETQEKFAKKIGRSKNSVSGKLNCKTQFTQSDIEIWAETLGIEKKYYGSYFFK